MSTEFILHMRGAASGEISNAETLQASEILVDFAVRAGVLSDQDAAELRGRIAAAVAGAARRGIRDQAAAIFG